MKAKKFYIDEESSVELEIIKRQTGKNYSTIVNEAIKNYSEASEDTAPILNVDTSQIEEKLEAILNVVTRRNDKIVISYLDYLWQALLIKDLPSTPALEESKRCLAEFKRNLNSDKFND